MKRAMKKLLAGGMNPIRATEKLVNEPNKTPTNTWRKCFALKSRLKRISSIKTRNAWNMNVATPISIDHIRFIEYGIELTGAEPNPDLIENGTPNVIR